MNNFWLDHPELDGQLEELWLAGLKTREIATVLSARTALDITRDAVIGRARRLKLIEHPTPPCRPKPVPVKEPETYAGPVTLEDITRNQCHWPVGNEGRALLYCGRTIKGHGPYCPACRKLAYQRKREHEVRTEA